MPTIIATPGAANANSFLTLEEFRDYYETRIPVNAWDDVDSEEAMIIMATRLLVAKFSPTRKLIRGAKPSESYYLVSPTWTGSVATTTQALPWPRSGMYDRNGNTIATDVVPQDLKNATAELALHLAIGDRTLDNDVALQGITSVRAGSVAVTFKNAGIDVTKIIPDIVFELLVPSWLTDEVQEYAQSASFVVVE